MYVSSLRFKALSLPLAMICAAKYDFKSFHMPYAVNLVSSNAFTCFYFDPWVHWHHGLHIACRVLFRSVVKYTLFLHSLAHALQLSAATWTIRGICALHPQRNILNVTSSTYHRQRSILNATSSMPHPQCNMYMNVNIPPHPQPLTSSTKNQP